ncbi:hypothetical protein DPMN_180358 [Dreissena polymorpha]|uniref:Uncharacterized protein n=1 Tax=Dreissena polymorpha TaxID=45954 RepID=A0A9D4IKE4_DREPO|nr:hypothetical protein DPMN_180358 [Dreissena polymorpha]
MIVVATCYELSSIFVDGPERGRTVEVFQNLKPTQNFLPITRFTIKRSNNVLETEWTY